MLIVKIVSDEDAADEDTRKRYRLLTGVVDVRFEREEDGSATMYVWYAGPLDERPTTFCIAGNVYIMNEGGKTISAFGGSPIPGLTARGAPLSS